MSSIEQVARSLPTAGIDFGYCPVKIPTAKSFMLNNPTQSTIRFILSTGDPLFVLNMANGTLGPKQKKEVKISYESENAKVLIASLTVKLAEGNNEQTFILKLSAIGKYPFITIDRQNFDFGSLLVGKSASKDITITNSSEVPTTFTIEKISDDGKDPSFSLNQSQGSLTPGQSVTVTVKYTPQIAESFSCAYYQVSALGGNQLEFGCKGKADGYQVELSVNSIHFGEVQHASSTNRLLNIQNNSDLPISFNFISDKSNVFSFSLTEGLIKAHSFVRIKINFTPIVCGNYYERVFCIVRNHKVGFVDLMGTCFDILTKPIPIQQRHIDAYRSKVILGQHKKIYQNKGNEILIDQMGISRDSLLVSIQDEEERQHHDGQKFEENQIVLHKEMLQSSAADLKDLKFSSDYVDFGFTLHGSLSESKQLILYNKFPFSVRIDWALLPVIDKKTGKEIKNPFNVRPIQQEIGANGNFVFDVDFAPFEPDGYFFQIAQCFVNLLNGNQFKTKKLTGPQPIQEILNMSKSVTSKKAGNKTLLGSLKQSKFIDYSQEEIDPPQCLSLRLMGHSFAPGSQPFIPMIKISSNKIALQACSPHESVYDTIQLSNTSDTPVQFKALQDSSNTFKVFPAVGQISGQSFQIITFEFNPKSPRFYNFAAQFIFNNSTVNMQQVQLQGFCYAPAINFPQEKLFFPPSFVGVQAKQKFKVKNDSRIAVEYEWRVPEKYGNEVSFEPNKALLQPNESINVVAQFTPLRKKEYQITVPLFTRNLFDLKKYSIGFFNPGSGQGMNEVYDSQVTLNTFKAATKSIQIIGAGSDGQIRISPDRLDFGTITVGYSKTLSVMITNNSNCNLYIELKMAQANGHLSQNELLVEQILTECFRFDNHQGIVNAKSKKKVNITFKPNQRFEFDTNLVCIARDKMNQELFNTLKASGGEISNKIGAQVEKSSIQIRCKGDFPLLRLTDVRNDQVSIANLWEHFELTKMNKELLLPLRQNEIQFNNSDKMTTSNDDLQKSLTSFTWDFGKIPIKSGGKPRKIRLTLKNVGGVQADWCFKMPNDSEIEMETWADPGEPNEEKAFEKEILDKKIFTIEPRKGSLAPGEQMDLSVNYYPKEVKKHHLNIFFQILNGKPLAITFMGETLHRRAQLSLLKHTYFMPPVPIGLEWAVTYPIEIKNLGITKLKYQIDTAKLEELNKKNFDFRIFEIQNPEGTLKSNDTQHIYTMFRPLEAKPYSLDLPIKVSDIEGPVKEQFTLRLRGSGYHEMSTKRNEIQFYEDLPLCRANLNENGSMAAFSTESIDFGEIAANEPSRRFVILYNLHQTQKLKFDFQKSGLMCGDNLKLEPMSGDLKPNSHCNIKMTLTSARYPTNFEGEICCSIDWEDSKVEDTKSVATNTNIPETSEYLFIRLKKRSKITKMQLGADVREAESLIENIVNEAMHEILESDEFDRLLEDCNTAKAGLYMNTVTNEAEPSQEDLLMDMDECEYPIQERMRQSFNKPATVYEEELKEVSGVDDGELFRKRMFLQEPFVELMEFMMEDTLFNLMEEATYEEFDLTQPPQIYIRKDA